MQDIHFIQEEYLEEYLPGHNKKEHKLSLLFFLAILLTIPFSLFFLPNLLKKCKSNKIDIELYKKEVANLIERNEVDKIYSLFLKFFSELCKIPINLVNEDRITDKLREKLKSKQLLDESKINLLLKFLNECAQYSFTSQEISNLHELQKKAEYWLVICFQALINNRKK